MSNRTGPNSYWWSSWPYQQSPSWFSVYHVQESCHKKKTLLYSSIIFGGFFFNGTLPLLFELAMECVYPFGEGIAGAILMTAGNVVLLFFYVAFMLPHSDVMMDELGNSIRPSSLCPRFVHLSRKVHTR